MNLPNKITLLRVILIPIMLIIPLFGIRATILGINVGNLIILAIFLIASFTDFLDGYIARKNDLVTDFGKFLDPIADKLLVITALIMLVEMRIIPGWIPIIIIAREFIVSGIRMIAAGKGTVIAASWYGKVKTVSQMVAISLAFISNYSFLSFATLSLRGFDLILNFLMTIAMLFAVAATIFSGVDYFNNSKDLILKSK